LDRVKKEHDHFGRHIKKLLCLVPNPHQLVPQDASLILDGALHFPIAAMKLKGTKKNTRRWTEAQKPVPAGTQGGIFYV
jgi:hypothetical protein